MYLYLAKSLDTMTTPTRGGNYNHDEISSAKDNYQAIAPGTSITDFTCSLKPQGLDLISAAGKANFDIASLQSLQSTSLVTGSEQLSPYAIRDCVQVTDGDIKDMAGDLALTISMALPEVTPKPNLPTYDERKFAKYKTKSKDVFGRKLKRTRHSERRLRQKKSLLQRQRTARLRNQKPKQSVNSITNFLFKLLF